MNTTFALHGKQAIIRTNSINWSQKDKLIESKFFKVMIEKYLKSLRANESELLNIFPKINENEQNHLVLKLIKALSKNEKNKVIESNPELKVFFEDIYSLDQFVEELYNYWRKFERYLIYTPKESEINPTANKKPYRIFNSTIEELNHKVRSLYRDIRENITGEHPIIFRQMPAGCQVGVIATNKKTKLPSKYNNLEKIPIIRQVLIEPPLIIDPPNNKRKGEFKVVQSNPIEGIEFNDKEWLCFPAKVGELIIHFYFHNFYMGLGISTANLFELCTEEELEQKPDAIYAYGVSNESLESFAPDKTVFFNDKKNKLMVAAIPLGEEFGYFGYVKKMILTLHNSIMISKGRMPIHGAMTRITLKNGKKANVIILGDSGTGKSESLEAFRHLSEGNLKDMKIVFDDMGSLELTPEKEVLAYGTETGAFVRLDDLDSGYAFGNIDRSIIMSPSKVNARAVLPITTLYEVLHGWNIDFLLYANNYLEIKETCITKFNSPEEALSVFREGKRMAKGTTIEIGMASAYFANIFGPSQFKEKHELIAKQFFDALFEKGVYVGQINTQLGIKGMERNGPQLAAKELFRMIDK